VLAQLCHRKFFRVSTAQTKFAAAFRGHVQRKHVRLVKKRRVACATAIQRGWWRYLADKLHGATVIQCMARRVAAVAKLARKRVEREAAIVIQCMLRTRLSMITFQYYLHKWRSAIKLQRNWRGYATRLGRFRGLMEIHGFLCKMADKITRRVRGIRDRRRAALRRKAVLIAEENRHKAEKMFTDKAVKLALSRSKFFLEAPEGQMFVKRERAKIVAKRKDPDYLERVEALSPEDRRKLSMQVSARETKCCPRSLLTLLLRRRTRSTPSTWTPPARSTRTNSTSCSGSAGSS
jgi:hypothetical protein